MPKEYYHVLESNNTQEIKEILKIEENYETHEELGFKVDIMRVNNLGAYGVFISTESESFTDNEMALINDYCKNIGRPLDVKGRDRVGIIFDKIQDIKPFSSMDMNFTYNKSYKTLRYARMIGLAWLYSIKEFYLESPDKPQSFYQYI
ncbi:hypothetical protein [Staphylococcus phage PMBT8]|nr:hypothetical protein [Staphylococcus phage PMBT8]